MTADDIRRLYWAEPLVPFQLILSDGREVRVTSPGHLTISVISDRITVCPRIEEFDLIDLSSVTGFRPLSAPIR
jgi:hypothetical protein